MISPKEKAQELITKFSPLVTTWDCYWDTPRNEDDVVVDAKKCALIAIKFAKENPLNSDGYNKYLDEVEQEIELIRGGK
jgi:hypothetical protein